MNKTTRWVLVTCLLGQLLVGQSQLIVVPLEGHPDRARVLASAGVLIGWGETIGVLPGSETAINTLSSKGLPHVMVAGPAAGRQLYLLHRPLAASLPATAGIHYETESELLVSVPPQDAAALAQACRGHHGGLVRILGDSLRVAPQDEAPSWGDSPTIAPNPEIQAMVAQVDGANLLADVSTLSAFHTRRSDRPEGVQAQNLLVGQLQAIPGLTVSTHSFDSGADNVIAELPGAVEPGRIVILGAHYDSLASGGSAAAAPGADDNASGTAAVLEVARILTQYQLRHTVRFALFASEEFGLVGSQAYAQMLVNQSADVLAMVNTDMNAYRAAGEPRDVVFITNDTTPALNSFGIDVTASYVPDLPATTASLGGGSSDHRSFHQRGFPATFPFEDIPSYSPHIHTANDVVGTSANDMELSAQITRALVALVAEIAVPVSLDILHTPLTSTGDPDGPYRVLTQVTSLVGSQVVSASVSGTGAAGPFLIPMIPTATPDEWIADISGQPLGTTVEYAIEAVDDQGRVARFPAASFGAGSGQSALTFEVGGQTAFWSDDFEGASLWTHGQLATQDDWQLGAPQGSSTDPTGAWSGTQAWANDLGLSGWNGAYQNNVSSWLRSPSIDCTGRTGVHLRLRRWLGVEDGWYDQARILVEGQQVWANPATPGGGSDNLVDSTWRLMDLDISSIADGNPAVEIEFRLQSDGGVVFGGWNVDDVALTEPDPPVLRSLVADRTFLSLGSATPATLAIDFGSAHGGQPYLALPGLSGSTPGTNVGQLVVPLNVDVVSLHVYAYLLNSTSFAGFSGYLDASGRAIATLAVPPGTDPLIAGVTVTVAAVTLSPLDATSNAVDILIVP